MRRSILGGLVLLAGMAGVFVYNGVATEEEFQRLIAKGDRAGAAGQGFAAIEAYSGALALNPDSMAVYLKRGETYHAQGDHQTARRDLLMAAQLDPSATRPHERLGDVSMALDAFDDAAEHYGQFVRLDDQNPHVLYKLALARQGSGRIARAVPLLRQAIALNASLGEAHYVLGLCLREQGRLEEARAALEQAIELSPGLLQAREALSVMHRARGDRRVSSSNSMRWQPSMVRILRGTSPGHWHTPAPDDRRRLCSHSVRRPNSTRTTRRFLPPLDKSGSPPPRAPETRSRSQTPWRHCGRSRSAPRQATRSPCSVARCD